MKGYYGLNKENVALDNTKCIVVTKNGDSVGTIALKTLRGKYLGKKLYSFGCISDTHTFVNSSYTDDTTANDDYIKAIQFFRDNNCNFTCICGDLTCRGTWFNQGTYGNELEHFQILTNANRGNMPVYTIAGNHEHWWRCDSSTTSLEEFEDYLQNYTGHPLCYTFTKGNDVFIMCGCVTNNEVFNQSTIQWLYEQLEENRNKRCFLFIHSFIKGSQYCGDCMELYPFNMISGNYNTAFINLLSHYRNVIYFHGHSHELFEMQEYTEGLYSSPPCNYDYTLGSHSVHIPSLAIPIDSTTGERIRINEGSQGYMIDVFENGIVLKGRDFKKDSWVPIGTYQINTTLVNVHEKTFTDTTGLITTS